MHLADRRLVRTLEPRPMKMQHLEVVPQEVDVACVAYGTVLGRGRPIARHKRARRSRHRQLRCTLCRGHLARHGVRLDHSESRLPGAVPWTRA